MAGLSDRERRKVDSRDDEQFYSRPRLVTHVDDAFCDRLTDLYAQELSPGDRVFDAMSSHVSHLPPLSLGEVVGHGMNAEELAANERLDEWFVQNFNDEQTLPLETESFDAVLCAVSVQYLQYPTDVFAEFARVLAPDGVLIVSFSNRMFPTKAVRVWRESSMDDRAALVRRYVESTRAFEDQSVVAEQPGRDPFYAVVAHRQS
ncbi:MAG: methyltransferase domain-containing protein [Halovenus sp.]